MILRGALTLAALLMLTACGNAFAPAERQTTTTAPPSAPPAPAIARAAPVTPPPASTAPKLRISDLIGRETAQIDARLGAPNLVRNEGDGELRVYRNEACILHVFAYPRGPNRASRQATHIEARTPDGQIVGPAADACLARFAQT